MGDKQREAKPSVLLIREWEQQMSSSGCCGRLEGDFLAPQGERCFPERRATMEAMGPLYRALRAEYGDRVDINVVDPRNMVTILSLLARDFRAHRPGLRHMLATLFRLGVTSVVVNGRLIARGRWPALAEVRVSLGEVAHGTDAHRSASEEVAGGVA